MLHLELKNLKKKFIDNLYLNERDNFGKFKYWLQKYFKFFIKERYYLFIKYFSRLNIEK